MLDLKSLIPWGRNASVPVKHEEHKDSLASLHREVDRLFVDFFRGFNGLGARPSGTMGNGWSPVLPSLDVRESEKELVVSAELPGVDDKDIDVTLSGDVLTIRGEKKQEHEEEEGTRRYVERSYGSFSRSLRLPFEPGDQKVDADFEKGVLTVRISRPAELQSRVKHVEVKAG